MRHLNYNHLLYFWSVAKCGSVAAAAVENFVTPQTISGQLRLLEQSLDAPLFERSGRRLELTEFGRLVLEQCDEIFVRGAELARLVNTRTNAGLQSLRAGIVDSIPKLIAERILATVLTDDHSVRLACREQGLEELLAELAVNRLDIVLSDQPVPPGLSLKAYSHRLGRSNLSFFSKGKRVTALRRGFPHSLTDEAMLLPSSRSALRRQIDAWLDRHAIRPHVVGEFDDSALMKAFGESGAGVVVAPAVIESEVKRMYRMGVIGTTDELQEDFYAITVQRQLRHPAIQSMCTSAQEWLDG